jgi:hypothetical protein
MNKEKNGAMSAGRTAGISGWKEQEITDITISPIIILLTSHLIITERHATSGFGGINFIHC